jgi:hypothetical protein
VAHDIAMPFAGSGFAASDRADLVAASSSPSQDAAVPRAANAYDVIIATDFRFHGGSGETTLVEIGLQHAAGLRTGIYHLPSVLVTRPMPFHPGVAQALAGGSCELLNFALPAACRLLLFRHPTVLADPRIALPAIEAETIALVVNQPPVDALGREGYRLADVVARLAAAYGKPPRIYPVGPQIRAQLTEDYGDRVVLQAQDWVNTVDAQRFETPRPAPRNPIRIGRHSLPGAEKWPDTGADILKAYPERDGVEIRILGGTRVAEHILRRRPKNWTVYDYGTRTPEDFLREIDVFVYFHHPRWVEAFGRAILEAAASGTPIVVPHAFKALLGDAAIYCAADEVESWVERLRAPAEYRKWARKARAFAQGFRPEIHLERLAEFGIAARAAGADGDGTLVPARKPAGAAAWRLDEMWTCGFVVLDASAGASACIQNLRQWISLVFSQAAYVVLPQHAAREPFGAWISIRRFAESDDEVVKAFAGLTTKAIGADGKYAVLYVLREGGDAGFNIEDVQSGLLRAYAASASRPRCGAENLNAAAAQQA